MEELQSKALMMMINETWYSLDPGALLERHGGAA
jgi:hypothetical protein